MKHLLPLLLVTTIWSCNNTAPAEKEAQGNEAKPAVATNASKVDSTVRVELAEPGPMLPPVPAVILGVGGDSIIPDALVCVWTFVVEGDPGMVGISVSTKGSKGHELTEEYYVQALLRKHKSFTLNVPDQTWVKQFDDIDVSGHKWEDKFAKHNFHRLPSKFIDAPGIAEAAIVLECEVVQDCALPPYRHVYFAKVKRVTTFKGVTDDKGRLLSDSRKFFGMTSGNGEFWTFGENIGHIGMNSGRAEVKY